MPRRFNQVLTKYAQNLRKKSTKEENKLWYEFLRDYKYKFHRQYVFGEYIADFYCAKARLVIELDGSQHYEPDMQVKDQVRTEYIEQFGIEVLRFPNNVVNKKFEELKIYIDYYVQQKLE